MSSTTTGLVVKQRAAGERPPKEHPFLPRALHTQRALRVLRRTHSWLGMSGAIAGVIMGITGITLNHRATLNSRLPTTITNYQVEAPARGFASQSAFEGFLEAELDINGPTRERRGGLPRPAIAELGGRQLEQPRHFEAYYASAGEVIDISFVAGNRFIEVEHTDRGFIATLNRLHLATVSGIGWILIVDAFSGAMVVLSITGLLLWSRLTGPRLLAIGLASTMLFGAIYYANLL